jgi:hypothetical protein
MTGHQQRTNERQKFMYKHINKPPPTHPPSPSPLPHIILPHRNPPSNPPQ